MDSPIATGRGFRPARSGWQVVFGAAGRAEALAYVEQNWTDIRPLSLRIQSHGALS